MRDRAEPVNPYHKARTRMVSILRGYQKLNIRTRIFDRYCRINGLPLDGASYHRFSISWRKLKSLDADRRAIGRRELHIDGGTLIG